MTSTEPQVVNISDDKFGLPDEDETKGSEWDTVIPSPPKGKKHAT